MFNVSSAQPLLKVSMSMKDALILVLRKAMFSRYSKKRSTHPNVFSSVSSYD